MSIYTFFLKVYLKVNLSAENGKVAHAGYFREKEENVWNNHLGKRNRKLSVLDTHLRYVL